MRRTRFAALTVGLICAVFFMTSCSTYQNFKEAFFEKEGQAADTIRIGVLEPQTGNDSPMGDLEIQGIELAHKLVPEIAGKKVELIYADTQSSIYAAETAVDALIEKKPAIVLGSYGDAVSLTASQKLGEKQIPAIAVTATNPLITANNPYYFRVSFTDASQGRALADYVFHSLQLPQAAVVKVRGEDTATEMVSQFSVRLEKLTGDENCIAESMEIPQDVKDCAKYAERLKASGVQAVFMPVSLTYAEKMFDAVVKAGILNLTFVGPKDWHGDELIKLQQKYPQITIAVAADFTAEKAVGAEVETETGELYDEFLAEYKKNYGKDEAPEAVALGFDAYMLAVQAIEQAGDVSGAKIKDALLMTENFGGASGDISFNENGEPKKTINIDVIQDGKFVSIYTVK